jgi:E3 ubiquitin ligase SMURF1/2
MSQDDPEPVKGQIIVSLMSRDGTCGGGTPLAIVGPGGDVQGPDDDDVIHDELPEGWEDRRTPQGRIYYVNHVTKTTQWPRPTEPAIVQAQQQQAAQNGTAEPLPAGPSRSTTTTCITSSIPATETTPNRRHSTEILLSSNNKENCNSNKERTKDEQIINLNNR